MVVSQNTLKSDIWNIFRNLINTNVTSVTIKGSGGANTKTVTIKSLSSSFPDEFFDVEANYPIITIGSPSFRTNPVTFRNRELEGTIEFQVFTTQSESADKIIDLINKTLMDNETTITSNGLENLEIDSTDENHYNRGNMNVHSRMLVWRYKFSW